jgi:hypothetical protein
VLWQSLKRHKVKWITGFFILHFFILGFGMIKWPAGRFNGIRKVVALYSRATGAGGSYGFFAPGIPKQVSVRFHIETIDNKSIDTTLEDETTTEVTYRIGNMIRLFTKNFKNGPIMRSLSASLAASVFEQYPTAKTVTLMTLVYDFPTMDDVRNGKKPEYKEIYKVQFARKS